MASGFKIADAFVEIHANSANLRRDIEAELNNVDVDALGRRLGAAVRGGIGNGLGGGGGGGGAGIVGTTLGTMATKMGVATVAGAGLVAVAAELTGVLGLLPAAGIAGGLAIGTLSLATSGFGDAIKNVGDPAKFAESIAALAPSAQSAAIAIRDLKPQFDSLKTAVQDQFFAGLGGMFTELAGSYIPMVQSSMTTVAGGVNTMIRGIGAEFMEAGRQADMRMILDSSARSVNNLLAGVRPMVAAFIDIGAVGAPIFEDLTSKVGPLADRFAAFIEKARESGQLGTWIQTGLQAFQDLWYIVTTLFGAVQTLVAALGGPDTLLGTLTLVAEALDAVATFIQDNITWIGPLAIAIGTMTTAWKAYNVVMKLVNAITKVNPWVALIGFIIAIAIFIYQNWDKIKEYLQIAWDWIKGVAESVWNGIKDFFTGVITGIRDFIVGIWTTVTNWLTAKWTEIKAKAQALWNLVKDSISNAIQGAKDKVTGVVDAIKGFLSGAWNTIKDTVSRVWNAIKGAISGAIDGAWNVISGLPGKIKGVFSAAGSWLKDAGGDLIRGLWNGIKNVTGWIMDKIKGFGKSIVSGIKGIFGIGSPSKVFADEVGRWLPPGIAVGMEANLTPVTDAAKSMLDASLPDMSGPRAGSGMTPNAMADVAARSVGDANLARNGAAVNVDNLHLHIAGNLDPTNPTAWRQAMESIRTGIRQVERSYS